MLVIPTRDYVVNLKSKILIIVKLTCYLITGVKKINL